MLGNRSFPHIPLWEIYAQQQQWLRRILKMPRICNNAPTHIPNQAVLPKAQTADLVSHIQAAAVAWLASFAALSGYLDETDGGEYGFEFGEQEAGVTADTTPSAASRRPPPSWRCSRAP